MQIVKGFVLVIAGLIIGGCAVVTYFAWMFSNLHW